MKSDFLQDFNSAFWVWGNHIIGNKAETVHLKTEQTLYLQNDPSISGYYSYNSRYKPWCADLSLISGTPTGFNSSSGIINATGSGVQIDYYNGRVLTTGYFGEKITGSFYSQEVGVYLDSSDEEYIVFENKYIENSRFYEAANTGVDPDVYKTPAVFLMIDSHQNEPYSFGGEDETCIYAKAAIVCENNFERDTLLSIFADSSKTMIPNVSSAQFPFNEFWNVTGAYNYNNFVNSTTDDGYFIDRVVCSRLSRSVQSKMPQHLSVGFVDFTICKIRYPRA